MLKKTSYFFSNFQKPLYGLFMVTVILSMTGCTQTRYLAHLYKNVTPDNKSVGKYKVGNAYQIKGRWYYPKEEFRKVETGIASWYGPNFDGKPTANGETYDQYALTAAHRTLQMPSVVRVTNLENGRSLILRVNDRGPFARGRILDVSKRGAELLGFKKQGVAKIRLEVLEKESRYAANLAKQGRSTTGIEIALNKGQPLPGLTSGTQVASASSSANNASQVSKQRARAYTGQPVIMASARGPASTPSVIPSSKDTAKRDIKPVSVQRERLSPDLRRSDKANNAPTSLEESEKMVRHTTPVSSELYVQAGAFSNYGNAARLRTSLARLGQSKISEIQVKGRKFYRVRIGPVESVTRADTILEALASKGNEEAMIVVQ